MRIQKNTVNTFVRGFGFPPPLGAKKLVLSPVRRAANKRGGVTKSNIKNGPISTANAIKSIMVIARQIPNVASENINVFCKNIC
jgi:hypothetical protein